MHSKAPGPIDIAIVKVAQASALQTLSILATAKICERLPPRKPAPSAVSSAAHAPPMRLRRLVAVCVAAAASSSRPHEARSSHPRGSMIVITGTGRTGTTFLMTVLTALGLPTGLDFATWSANRTSPYAPPNAGLEFDCDWAGKSAACLQTLRRRGALIVKAPALASEAAAREWTDAEGGSPVRAAIVPVRDIRAAALSRARNGAGNGGYTGSAKTVEEQERVADHDLARLVVQLALNAMPTTFLAYPAHVLDADYAYRRLAWLVGHFNATEAAFKAAHARFSDASLVHRRRRRR